MRTAFVGIVLAATACSDQATESDVRVTQPNELGVTNLLIEHGRNDADRLLSIRGLDDRGNVIGVVTLRTGVVSYTPEPDLMPPAESMGTELTLEVAGVTEFPEVYPNLDPHATRTPLHHATETFVRIAAVAAAVRDEAQITFTLRGGETAFSGTATDCYGSEHDFPTTIGGQSSGQIDYCCSDSGGGFTAHRAPSGSASPGAIVLRTYGTPCTGAYGPCGGAAAGGPSGNNAIVFVPSFPNDGYCGWDDRTGNYYPEVYTNQTPYPAINPACTCTGCSGSTPTPLGCS